jgi:hypothetical protein
MEESAAYNEMKLSTLFAVLKFAYAVRWKIVGAATRFGVVKSSSRSGFDHTAIFTHLGRETTNAMLIQQVPERANGKMEKFRGTGLAVCSSLEGFQDKYLFKVLQMRDEV